MPRSSLLRYSGRVVAASAVAASVVLSVAVPHASADVPPQQPGVTLRVFDVQVPLDRLCTIKAGQTPNVDKLMPTINWSSATDFGFENYFVAHVLGNVNIPTAGSYTFRLTSDDGSRLIIDDTIVIDNDGVHGAEPKEGTINLTTGYHSLRLEMFERDYGQRLTLDWRPPGATSFTLVPNSALSTDAGVTRVTAPGRKECEASGDTPGDGQPLIAVNPNYTLTNLRPNGFQPQVTGMDWFPDGRLAVATWGGSNNSVGEVYVLSNVTGNTSPSQVTTRRVASGLKEPQGLKIVDGKIYVSQKHELTELNDTNGDGVTDQYRRVAAWPIGTNYHEFAFGLLYQDGYFYLSLSVGINAADGHTIAPQSSASRGTTIKVNRATGEVSYVAGGLRTPNGIGWGPEGEIFVNDNQGDWLPSSKLVHIKQDRFFNANINPPSIFQSRPVTQPALWLPQNEIANSPSTPVQLTSGPFAGQMLFGDVTYGGIQRGFLEKVGGEYQGAVFRLTQGLEAGINRISVGPDGAIYAGGIGAGGNWGQPGKLTYGLQKLTPNGTNTFDMVAMRVVPGGFEVEYTKPLSAETANALATKYRISQWRYVPTTSYGGPKVDNQTLTVRSASLSADRMKVNLQIEGLLPGRVVHLRSPRPFTASDGQSLWSTEAWYTLNSTGTAAPPTNTTYEAESAALSGGATVMTDHCCYSGSGFVAGYGSGASTTFTVTAESAGAHEVGLRYSNGPYPFNGTKTLSVYVNGTKIRQTSLAATGNWETWATRTETLNLNAGTNTIAYRYDPEDNGVVNLDYITIAGTAAPPPPPSANLALNKPATADSSCASTQTAAKAVNGSVSGGNSDKWCSSGNPKWLQVDLGSDHNIGRFVVKHAAAGGESGALNTRDFTIRTSPEGTTWTGVVTATGNTAATTTHDILATNARYVRIDVTTPTSSGDTLGRIYEFEVYAASAPTRTTLFDGTNLAAWQHANGSAASWLLNNGAMEVRNGDIYTRQNFGDFRLHLEFWLPLYPPNVVGQARANSGVYLQGRYEVQVLDSYGDTTPANDECAAIYGRKAADHNAATAPETWQTYDITFRAARYNSAGAKTANARVSVVWNGVTVHNNVQIDSPTTLGSPESLSPGPIRLQDHGNPIRYRNVWIEPAT